MRRVKHEVTQKRSIQQQQHLYCTSYSAAAATTVHAAAAVAATYAAVSPPPSSTSTTDTNDVTMRDDDDDVQSWMLTVAIDTEHRPDDAGGLDVVSACARIGDVYETIVWQIARPSTTATAEHYQPHFSSMLHSLALSSRLMWVFHDYHDRAALSPLVFRFVTDIDSQMQSHKHAFFANEPSVRKRVSFGLDFLATRLAGMHIEKDIQIQCSDWSSFPLSPAQLDYARVDVLATLRVAEALDALAVALPVPLPLPMSILEACQGASRPSHTPLQIIDDRDDMATAWSSKAESTYTARFDTCTREKRLVEEVTELVLNDSFQGHCRRMQSFKNRLRNSCSSFVKLPASALENACEWLLRNHYLVIEQNKHTEPTVGEPLETRDTKVHFVKDGRCMYSNCNFKLTVTQPTM